MRITSVAFLAFAALASGEKHIGTPTGDVKVASTWGQRLLSKARKLGSDNYNEYMQYMQYYQDVRDGETENYYNQNQGYGENQNQGQNADGNQNWNNYDGGNQAYSNNNYKNGDDNGNQNWYANGDENDNEQYNDYENYAGAGNAWGGNSFDTSWMQDYSVKFDGCATDYDADVNGQTRTALLARFKLCPNNSKRCKNSGEYVVPMSDYVTAMQNVIASDENCKLQEEVCYSQCLQEARYGSAYDDDNNGGGGRRLQNNFNQWWNGQVDEWNNKQQQKSQSGSSWWNEQVEEWNNKQQEKYEDQQRQSDGSGQSSQYSNNVEYSAYNGGNNQNAYHSGQYNPSDYTSSYQQQASQNQQYGDSSSNYQENNNYYNRDNQDWRNYDESEYNNDAYGEGEEDGDGNGYYGQNGNYGRNGGNNNYFDEDYCRYNCMEDAGMSYCNENAEVNGANGYNEINIPEMVECHELDTYEAQSQQYYVGATCRNGGVYLDVFTDSSCSRAAPKNTHEQLVGYSLPQSNLVSNDVLSCSGTQTFVTSYNFEDYEEYEEYADQQYQTAVNLCDVLYQDAGKCEEKMKIDSQNTGGCDYINRLGSSDTTSHKWLRYGMFLVLAFCLFLAAYIGFSKSRREEAITKVKEVQSQVETQISTFMETSQRSLKEHLAPASDSSTVDSDTPDTPYTGPQIPPEEPMTTEPITPQEPEQETDVV